MIGAHKTLCHKHSNRVFYVTCQKEPEKFVFPSRKAVLPTSVGCWRHQRFATGSNSIIRSNDMSGSPATTIMRRSSRRWRRFKTTPELFRNFRFCKWSSFRSLGEPSKNGRFHALLRIIWQIDGLSKVIVNKLYVFCAIQTRLATIWESNTPNAKTNLAWLHTRGGVRENSKRIRTQNPATSGFSRRA